MASVTEVTVRYAETDRMGVTHHAVYPIWFEMARTDYIRNAAMSYAEMERQGVMIPVTGISCRYRLPTGYDDTLVITTKITRFSPARVEFSYTAVLKGETDIRCEGTKFRPLNLKKAMPELYARLEEEAAKDMAL